jgi:glycosyltransferase involved in cell wall biosynthesis
VKVLLLSLFHPELVRGGAQQVAYELFEGLQETEGVEPVLLCAIDPSFTAFYKSGACITGFDGRPNEFLFLSRAYDYTWQKAGDPALLSAYAEFLTVVKPDVVHVHHFLLFGIDLLTLTRRILPEARIVFTFHEFLSICAADGHMLRRNDNTLCTRASPVRCHQCFPDHGPEHFFIRERWMRKHLEAADVFTTPSKFMIERYVTWGIPRDKIVHVTNGQKDYSEGTVVRERREKHNRFGFFGQLVDVKGVWLLLEAVQILRSEGFHDLVVEINGDNLQYATVARREEFEMFMKAEQERPYEERIVFFNGLYSVDQLPQRMARIDWVVVPSTWWEIFALVISEAMMFRKPVITTNIGGPGERVRDGKDGLQFAVGDASSLAQALRRACQTDGLWARLSSEMASAPSRDQMVHGFARLYEGSGKRPSMVPWVA